MAIFCHRWMGLAFCVLFAWWFTSGIFMMYWDFPGVSPADRVSRAEPIDPGRIKLTPEEAFAKLGRDESPSSVQLSMFDGRPVYRFTLGSGRAGDGPAESTAAGGEGRRGGSDPKGGDVRRGGRSPRGRTRRPKAMFSITVMCRKSA